MIRTRRFDPRGAALTRPTRARPPIDRRGTAGRRDEDRREASGGGRALALEKTVVLLRVF